MSDAPHILVVEDEVAQLDVLTYNLRKAGYQVSPVADGDAAEEALEEILPDLILLDWMLPGVSGLELTRRIRARKETKTTPILMLTARAEEEDIVRGLDMGANDYIPKPYSITEVLARIRTNLRLHAKVGQNIMSVGPITLNNETHRVYVNDAEIDLGPLEFKLLRLLMSRPERVFSRMQLLDMVWGLEKDVGTRTVDVHVGRLRKSLGAECSDILRTVRGEGYALSVKNNTNSHHV